MSSHTDLVSAAREAVVAASSVCRQVQAGLDQIRAITKDDRSPVTVADFASQAIVAWTLRERLGLSWDGGAHPLRLVGEESSGFLREPEHAAHLEATLAAVRDVWEDATADDVLAAIDAGAGDADHASFWTLDPVDGTKGFLRNQQYAVALALIEDGTPTIGVMGCPNLPIDMSEPLDVPDAKGCTYFAVRNEGVYEASAEDATANPTRITRLDHDAEDEVSVTASVEEAHTNVSETDQVLDLLRDEHGLEIGEPVRLDSQCKYAVVARGQADAYLRMPTRPGYVERIWDHAAGSLIASEAGCAVSDIHGRELDFSHGRGLEKNKGVVCAPPRLHGLLIGAIAKVRG